MSSNPLDAYKEFDPKLIEQYEKLPDETNNGNRGIKTFPSYENV
jgi:hypothetical protein